jgi:hypothetical protein
MPLEMAEIEKMAAIWGEPAPQERWCYAAEQILRDLGFEHDPWQINFLNAHYRRALLLCSRRSGKTTVTALAALHEAMYPPVGKTATVLLFAPAGRQSDELLHGLHTMYERLTGLGVPEPRGSDKVSILDFANGSRIIPLPNNPDAIRGFTPTLIIIDEASRVPDDLYRALTPMLALERTNPARLIALTTPAGKRGWFWKEWFGKNPWQRVQVTADQCGRISRAFLEEEKQSHSAEYVQQEYFCSFENQEGLVYPGLSRAVIDPSPIAGRAFAGLDWGWHNPAAAIVGVLTHDGVLHAVEEVYGPRLTMDGEVAGDTAHNAGDFIALCQALARRWPIEMWYADPAEPRNIEKFRRCGLVAKPADNRILTGIQRVSTRLNTGQLLVHRTCTHLVEEAGLYRYPTEEEWRIAGENPIDEHNHALAGLRYLIAELDRARGTRDEGARLQRMEAKAARLERQPPPRSEVFAGPPDGEDTPPDRPAPFAAAGRPDGIKVGGRTAGMPRLAESPGVICPLNTCGITVRAEQSPMGLPCAGNGSDIQVFHRPLVLAKGTPYRGASTVA